jgi:hypothetical protein
MENENLIGTEEFCASHHIEFSFISSLQSSGLVEIATVQEKRFLPAEHLRTVEEYVRMHYDLDINIAGIEAITHLLGRVKDMQKEIMGLKNRLRKYEDIG